MIKTKTVVMLLFSFALMLSSTYPTQAQPSDPQETLKQYVVEFQNNPKDAALQRKIIKLAQEMNPPPAIPEEAKRNLDALLFVTGLLETGGVVKYEEMLEKSNKLRGRSHE